MLKYLIINHTTVLNSLSQFDEKVSSGVYIIVNKINGKFYIGSSIDLRKRKYQHFSNLKNNTHHNMYLQRAWNKHKKENFDFLIVEVCESEIVQTVEQKHLNYIFEKLDNPEKVCYNVSRCATGGDIISYHPQREEIIKKIQKTTIKNWNTAEYREKQDSLKLFGKDNPNYGNNWTAEQKEKQSLKAKDFFKKNPDASKKISKSKKEWFKIPENRKKHSDFAKTRTGVKNPFYGRRHTDEVKKQLANKHHGKYFGTQNIIVEINGKTYRSAGEAGLALGLPMTTVRWRIRSNNPKFKNYQYVKEKKKKLL